MIRSSRIKAGLQRRKDKGFTLGSPENLTPSAAAQGRKQGNIKVKENSQTYAKSIEHVISGLKTDGYHTPSELARALNARGVKARLGGRWHPKQVSRILEKLENI